jgi:polyhydroxybutyrate depolymerase
MRGASSDRPTSGWSPSWRALPRRLALIATVAAVAAMVGSTGESAGPLPRPAANQTPAVAPVLAGASAAARHPGCVGDTPMRHGLTVSLRPPLAGRLRSVRVHLPAGYVGSRPVPLLLSLHGTGSTAVKQETQTGLDATADAHGFIVAYPQAARPNGVGFAWNIPGTPTFTAAGPADVGFLTGLVDLLRQQFCVDLRRVYASGFSGGARMVSQLACEPSARLAGVLVAGGLRGPLPCHPAAPPVVIAFHGTADLANPYNGHGSSYWTYSVPEAAARWAGIDGCPAQPRTSRPYPGVTATDYPGCAGGAEVVLYTLAGKGHRWPAASGGFQPNEIGWRFLSGHALPAAVIGPATPDATATRTGPADPSGSAAPGGPADPDGAAAKS